MVSSRILVSVNFETYKGLFSVLTLPSIFIIHCKHFSLFTSCSRHFYSRPRFYSRHRTYDFIISHELINREQISPGKKNHNVSQGEVCPVTRPGSRMLTIFLQQLSQDMSLPCHIDNALLASILNNITSISERLCQHTTYFEGVAMSDGTDTLLVTEILIKLITNSSPGAYGVHMHYGERLHSVSMKIRSSEDLSNRPS